MKIMGIDASTTCTGYSIFEDGKLIDYGYIRPKGQHWRERLIQIGEQLKEILKQSMPDKIYMEDVPLMGTQKQTFVILGAVQGFILGIATSMNIEISFLLPSQWRSLMGLYDGSRQGTKKEMMKEKAVKMANKIFQLDLVWAGGKSVKNQDDIAESILIAYSQIKQKPISQ